MSAIEFDASGLMAKLGTMKEAAPDIARSAAYAGAKVIRDAAASSAQNIAYSGNPSKRIPDLRIDLVKGGATMADAIYAAYSQDKSTTYGDIATYDVSWRKSGKSGLPFTRFGPHVERGRVKFSREVDGKKVWIDLTKASNAHPFLAPSLSASLAEAKAAAERAGVEAARKAGAGRE